MSEYEPSIASLRYRPDEEVVRYWLAQRGLVAVERKLIEQLAAVDRNIVYAPDNDRYVRKINV